MSRVTRLFLIAGAIAALGACNQAATPSCTDKAVISELGRQAQGAIESGVLEADPAARIETVMERLPVSIENIASTSHDDTIDKHSCTAELLVTLPPEIAALKKHRAFRLLALGNLDVDIQDNTIVAPLTYTTYMSEQNRELVIRAEGERLPARYIRAAYKVGAFDADLTTLPDLRAGLSLYSGKGKTLLLKPLEDGSLEFQVSYETNHCRPWAQRITEEQDGTLIYDNTEVGCTVLFSRLGEILLVEHKGCEKMARSCSPDGVYQKR